MAVCRQGRTIDIGDMVFQILDLGTVFVRRAVTGRIRNVDDCGAGCNDGFHNPCQIFIVASSRIFGEKFDVIDIFFCIFHHLDGTFQNLFRRRVQLGINMVGRCADTGMDTSPLGIFQRFGSHIDIFLDRTGQSGNHRFFNHFRNFHNRLEITRAGNRKTGFDNVDTQIFQRSGNFDFFKRVQLAARNLFAIAQCGVKYDDFFCRVCRCADHDVLLWIIRLDFIQLDRKRLRLSLPRGQRPKNNGYVDKRYQHAWRARTNSSDRPNGISPQKRDKELNILTFMGKTISPFFNSCNIFRAGSMPGICSTAIKKQSVHHSLFSCS